MKKKGAPGFENGALFQKPKCALEINKKDTLWVSESDLFRETQMHSLR